MINAELIASGSINGFIGGKHFNRCKKLFTICALALRLLLIDRYFVENKIDDCSNIKQYLLQFAVPQNKQAFPKIDDHSTLLHLEDYNNFEECVYEGQYGFTAHYYANANKVFFSLNLFNYARWLVAYHNNCFNVEATHPGLREAHFQKGSFGVRSTVKSFSRQSTDFVTEETQNNDAASTAGVSNFSDSVGGRQRWCITHSFRTSNSSKIYDMCGMKNKQDVTGDLQNVQQTVEEVSQLTPRVKDRAIQVHICKPFRSKANQTKVRLVNQMASPLKPCLHSVSTSPFKIKHDVNREPSRPNINVLCKIVKRLEQSDRDTS
nr:unnamed protein product [Callosobruchus chinensis]